MVRKTFEHALGEISRQWELLKRLYGFATSDSNSATFSPCETNLNTIRLSADLLDMRYFKKMCRFVTMKNRKHDQNYDMVATGIPPNKLKQFECKGEM